MGAMQRNKGKSFERVIASQLRALWPGADVHRSSQAERAREPDVAIAGHAPELARRLWLELQDARKPTPLTKLAQAEKDIEAQSLLQMESRRPVVVWHKLLERTIWVTTRFWVLCELSGWSHTPDYRCAPTHELVVTVDWVAFLGVLQTLPVPAKAKEEAA
jgi:hypothetical protein